MNEWQNQIGILREKFLINNSLIIIIILYKICTSNDLKLKYLCIFFTITYKMVDIKTANTNLEDLTQMLEDMDNLDMDLLNNSFKNTSVTSIFKDSNSQLDGDLKRRITLKDSNEDDSLNGLLLDDDNSLKEKKNFLTSGSKSSLMEDLFKIKTPETSIKVNNESETKHNFAHGDINELLLQKSSNYAANSNSILLQSKTSTEKHDQKLQSVLKSKEDILSNRLGNSKLNLADDKSKRSSLIESLFENKPHSFFTKNVEFENSSYSTEFISTEKKQKSQPVEQSNKSLGRESRRGRRNTKVVNDPLGLLSTDLLSEQNLELVTDENVSAKDINVQNSKLEKNLPEWLGGTKKLEEKKSNEVKEEIIPKDYLPNDIERTTFDKQIIESQDIKSSTSAKVADENILIQGGLPLLFGTQFNQQAAIITMQQQEHELRTANMLSQQNEQLNKVSGTQQIILGDQEKQFNLLLKLQFERQLLLEKQIKTQQERIDQYIQNLMAQPMPISSSTSVYTSCKSEENGREKIILNEKEELEKKIEILQIEKSKLENLLITTNERHNNEVTCQIEFYERQISFLKEGMLKFEERVRQEIEVLETDYIVKLEKLRNDKIQMENLHKEEIHNLKNEHIKHIQELKELHSQNVSFLQKEYSNIIENICRAKQTEDEVIETIAIRKDDVENMLQNANCIIKTMKENKEKIEFKDIELTGRHENYLKVYEDDIKAQKLDLKNQTDIFKKDHNKFIETVEKFGTQFTQLMEQLQKHATHNNQMQKMLENKTAYLLRERELFEEKIKWERDYLETLKESWTKEQNRQLQLIQQEREAIVAEKAQLQTMNRLKLNSNDIAKVELEAAIQTAQEATACANHAKLKWQEKMNELNAHKQTLHDKENLLVLRAKELEKLTQLALTKKQEGMKALEDAKYLESQHKETLDLLQMQLKAVTGKEKRIASEQYNIIKGQMISVSCETEKPERDTNVSHSFNNELLPSSVVPSTSQITTELMKIVDPHLTMLKLSFDDNYDSITQNI
ncbi:fas-binding factor 1 twitchy isoform X2 [Megalopta genalis]|uniref:fas-binding factor 1 twitchy isoform X2 n=1 Tax=Megalopta genalis TaxID=115081 RepID=UPI003FD029B5